jgi:hypothetical protein
MEGKADDNIADTAPDERRDGDGGGDGSSERSRKGKVRYISILQRESLARVFFLFTRPDGKKRQSDGMGFFSSLFVRLQTTAGGILPRRRLVPVPRGERSRRIDGLETDQRRR